MAEPVFGLACLLAAGLAALALVAVPFLLSSLR